MKNIEEVIKECNLSLSEIENSYKDIYDSVFVSESVWLINVEEKTDSLSPQIKIDIEYIIAKLKGDGYIFSSVDSPQLATFTAYINTIIRVANRINNFKEGTKLDNGEILHLYDLFNAIKGVNHLKDLDYNLNKNLRSFLPHLFSVIKHCQDPNEYPVYYKYWKNILGEILKRKSDYDSLCEFYITIDRPKHLNMGAYFGTIGTVLANKITESNLIKEKDDKVYRYVRNILNIHYFDLIEGYLGKSNDYEIEFSEWLKDDITSKSNKPASYIRAIKILSDILKEKIFEKTDIAELNILYDDLVAEQGNENGKYYYEDASSYGESGFYSASIGSYIKFLRSLNLDKNSETRDKMANLVKKNNLAQAICVVGSSGVGKTFRVNKTLINAGHKTLTVIVDSMWQHILFDYMPEKREYCLTKIGEFIKKAQSDGKNLYTIVIDECHKNLEIINDVLLQAISTKRNDGIRFLSLNSLVDEKFSFLTEVNGNRILPENLGFIFISSKSDIIEGNDDLRNRIEIVELEANNQIDDDYSIDYLLRKIKKEEQNAFSM